MAYRSKDMILELMQSQSVVRFGDIQAALDGASRSTVFRYLEQIPYRSSCNYNGRFYILHDPSKFDRWGLYSVGDAHFSTDGTIKATVVRLVRESAAGWTHTELQDLLQVRVQLFLLTACREGVITREQINRLYIYLHAELEVRQAQLDQRRKQIDEVKLDSVEIDDEITIRILIVMLRHPGCRPGDVVRRLKGRSPPVSRPQVDKVFARYGLDEKGGPRIF